MMDLRNLETFYYIAKLGTFQAAAKKLFTTQPGISQRISNLEEGLGVSLFNRDKRRVSLTSKGQELLLYAEKMLQLRQDAQVAMDVNNQTMRGTVRLGVSEVLTYTWVPHLIQRLNALYPELVIEVQVGVSPVMETQLRNRQMDLIFTIGSIEDSDYESLPLCQYQMKYIAGLGLDVGPSSVVSLSDLAQLPMITTPPNTTYDDLVQKPFRELATKPLVTCKTLSLNMGLRMLQQNSGFALLTPVVCSQMIRHDELRVLDIQKGVELPVSNYTSLWMKGPDSYIPIRVAKIAQQVAQEESSLGAAH